MKKFRWDYQKEDFISDFTTYAYQIQLDGELYPVGQEVETEGRHMLCVQAVDSAGNKAEAEAGFVVDHTPPEILFLDLEDSPLIYPLRFSKRRNLPVCILPLHLYLATP